MRRKALKKRKELFSMQVRSCFSKLSCFHTQDWSVSGVRKNKGTSLLQQKLLKSDDNKKKEKMYLKRRLFRI